jgi:hypothetical protein
MTERDWDGWTDPQPLLEFVQAGGKASSRKLRLYSCACVRQA